MKNTATEFIARKKRRPAYLSLFNTLVCAFLLVFAVGGHAAATGLPGAGAGGSYDGHILLTKADSRTPASKPPAQRRERRQANKQPQNPTVASRSLAHKDARCSVMVSYPQVGNDKIDAELDFWANKTVSTFVSGVESFAASGSNRYSMLVDYELSEVSDRFVSIVFRITTDTGGASPDSGMVTFTYDRSDGRNLSMRDIFGDTSGLLHFLSLHSYETLLAQLGTAFENKIRQGTTPDLLNFSLFSIDSDGMVLYFPPYQVADYTLGEQKVRIGAQDLKPYMPRTDLWNGSGKFGSNTPRLERAFELAPGQSAK